jgi:hypothetical protein
MSFNPIATLDELLSQLPAHLQRPDVTLTEIQDYRSNQRALACREMNKMAEQFAKDDQERRRLWGDKFPKVLGEKPPDKPKSINQVKRKKGKRGGTSGKVGHVRG